MIEHLTCEVGNHEFTRERKKGVKPRVCPEHKGAMLPERKDKPVIKVSYRTPAIDYVMNAKVKVPTSPGAGSTDPMYEFQSKVKYVVNQLENNQENREPEDVVLLKQIYAGYLKEANKLYKPEVFDETENS